jgi:ParB/RepB/Spo0J family partition protein
MGLKDELSRMDDSVAAPRTGDRLRASRGSGSLPAPTALMQGMAGYEDLKRKYDDLLKNIGATSLGTVLVKIKVDLLVDSPYQPRLKYDDSKLAELAESLRNRQIDPLSVRSRSDGTYEIISGHRRKRAAPLANIKELDCLVLEVTDAEARVLVLAANEPHEDFTDFERARAYRAILDDGKKGGVIRTQQQLASSIGIDQSLVGRRLSMLELSSEIQEILVQYPGAFSCRWVSRLRELTAKPHDDDKLRQALLRVAKSEISMGALFSVVSAGAKRADGVPHPQRGLILQKDNQLFAQVTPNGAKRQITVKLPGDCSLDEVAQLILGALSSRFSGGGQ